MKDSTFLNRIAAKLDVCHHFGKDALPFKTCDELKRLYRTAQEPAPEEVEHPPELPVPEATRLLKRGKFFLKQLTLPGVL